MKFKKFDIVKINNESDEYHGKRGVIMKRRKFENLTNLVCFTIDDWGIFDDNELEFIK